MAPLLLWRDAYHHVHPHSMSIITDSTFQGNMHNHHKILIQLRVSYHPSLLHGGVTDERNHGILFDPQKSRKSLHLKIDRARNCLTNLVRE